MLLASVDGMLGRGDARAVHAELCERYPFFARWWCAESAELLLR